MRRHAFLHRVARRWTPQTGMRDFTVRVLFRQFATGGLVAIPSRAVDEATGAVTNTAPGVPLLTSWIPPPDAPVPAHRPVRRSGGIRRTSCTARRLLMSYSAAGR